MIKVNKLIKNFGKVKVLKELDLEIEENGIFAVLGPNGSGKTTLIKCILGMVIPNKGSIEIGGHNILGKYRYRQNIDYLPQIASFPPNLTLTELINMMKDLRSKPANHDKLIDMFRLEEFLNKKIRNLSGGTRQKVNLVLAFMFDSPIIFLDEPTSGLDPISMIQLKKLIRMEKAKGKTIVITSHIMSFVEEMSDEIVFLLDGKIYFKGTTENLKLKTGQTDFETAIASLLTGANV